jgi:hypothetical protein
MAQLKQIIQPIASLNLSSITILTDPVGTLTTTDAGNWKAITTKTLTPSDIKNNAFQVIDITVAWSGYINKNVGSTKWRVTLNDEAVNAQEPAGSISSAVKDYEQTFRIKTYGQNNVVKIEGYNSADAGENMATTNVVFTGRALTYV